ncbi:MAG: response regulator transcription factor [Clostridiaceae bacterium]|nr:response regulator transcription factor [Clostridiaceae bacterium]
MYKLLIVEDEVWEREGLASFLDWSKLSIEVIGTAANGRQGLQMAKEHLPDIIMTDIRMPIMDGLELSREVKRFLPNCKIIIITGYDDFQYARDAIHIGVYDYLLKPIQKTELLNTINKTKAGLDQENQQEEHISKLKNNLTESTYKERERFLLEILQGNVKCRNDSSDTEDLMFSFCSKNMVAIVIRIDGFSYYMEAGNNENKENLKEFYREIRQIVGNKGLTAEYYMEKREIVICLSVGQDSRNEINRIVQQIQQLNGDIKRLEYIIGVGSLSNSASDFTKSFNHAQAALNRIFFLRDTNILFYDDFFHENDANEASVCCFLQSAPDYSKQILNAVISLDAHEINALTEEFFSFIYNHSVDKSLVCNFLAGMMNELSILLFSNNAMLNSGNNTGDDIIERFHSCIKLEQLKVFIQKRLIYANEFFSKKRKNKEEYIIDDAMSIIHNDYNQNIGLEIIAHRLGISPNYLGGLFKKYVGKRFTQVLTSFRMKKAEELLLSGEDSILDIAKAVGYDNISYFCTVFKKNHGISPMEYREKNAYENKNSK